MRIDYLGLEAFVAIAELGSFNKAAEQLNLSQTALSHRIRKVEADLGVQLLMRTTREVSLTKVGQEMLPLVRSHLNDLSRLYGEARQRGRYRQKRLSFACLPTVSNYYLPTILKQFSEQSPDIAVRLFDQPMARIPELVQAGEAEFGITVFGANVPDLDFQPLYREPYVLLVPQGHPLAGRKGISRAELVGHPFVRITTQSANRQLVDESLAEYSGEIVWRYEVQNATTAMSLVAAGVALTVLPKLTADLAAGTLKALEFTDVDMARSLGVLTRRGMPLSKPADRLRGMIRDRLSAL